jgi:hypothetical protein
MAPGVTHWVSWSSGFLPFAFFVCGGTYILQLDSYSCSSLTFLGFPSQNPRFSGAGFTFFACPRSLVWNTKISLDLPALSGAFRVRVLGAPPGRVVLLRLRWRLGAPRPLAQILAAFPWCSPRIQCLSRRYHRLPVALFQVSNGRPGPRRRHLRFRRCPGARG